MARRLGKSAALATVILTLAVVAACAANQATPSPAAASPSSADSAATRPAESEAPPAASSPPSASPAETALSAGSAVSTPTTVPRSTTTYGIGAAYTPALATWFNAGCKPGDVMIGLAMTDLNNVHCGSRQLLFNSEATAEATLADLAAANDLPDTVGYDFEHRLATPSAEQEDPVTYAQRFRALASKYGFQLLFAPDRTYGQQLAGKLAPYFDVWAFQLQQFDGSSQLFSYANPIYDSIRSANHAIRVSMQFRPTVTSAQIKTIVDQFAVSGRKPDVISLLYTDPAQVIDLSSVLRP